MCKSTITVNVDTEFRSPPECPREGDVHCKVVRADCEIVDRWDHWVTFKLRLLLKLKLESCRCRECIFFREVVVTETIRVDGPWWVHGCDVKGAVCKCVVHRGRVHCNLTALVQFHLKPQHHCWPEWHGDCDWPDDWERNHDSCRHHACEKDCVCHRRHGWEKDCNCRRHRGPEREADSGWAWHDERSGSDRHHNWEREAESGWTWHDGTSGSDRPVQVVHGRG